MRSLDGLLDRLTRPVLDSPPPGFEPLTTRIVIVTSTGEPGVDASAAIAQSWMDARPNARVVQAPPAATWPFAAALDSSDAPAILWMPRVHEAFVNCQGSGTRLVTTQASYLLLSWLAETAGKELLLLATANRESLEPHAPEVLSRRGGLGAIFLHTPSSVADGIARGVTPDDSIDPSIGEPSAATVLADAFRRRDPAERLERCVHALEYGRTPPALVAAASACMEVNDLDAAERDLADALALRPDWAAAHFEQGKLWLRRDDMERASVSFRAAAERLPTFGSAWANLGATLGELDRPGEALAAFERALECDPSSHQALNNIGVVKRELGQLAESEAALRRVTTLVPDLAFGYYNLGHTLFLQGRYQAALSAYSEGQKRDAERNPVQASRLALCRLASGDPGGALNALQQAVGRVPRDYRRQLLADTSSILMALLTHRPDLAGWDRVNGWVSTELGKLS